MAEGQLKELAIIIKADVQGSAEVLADTLAKLSEERVKVRIIHSGVGAINESDVLLASASKAIIIGFNVKPDRNAAEAVRGLKLYVERSALPATGEREWYEADLVGLPAVGRDGRDWGKVMAFHDFGAGLMLEVSGGSASRNAVMLPFTDEAVPEVDVDGGRVVVDPPAGLLAGGEAKEAQE